MGASPGWGLNYDPPAAEWNFWWSSKVDVANPVLSGPLVPAAWSTGGRPTSPLLYATGWNTTISSLETWNGSSWVSSTGAGSFLPLTGGSLSGPMTGTFVNLFPGTTQFSGSGTVVPALNLNTNLSGTQTAAGFWGWNSIVVNQDLLNATGAGGGINDLSIVHNFGGAGFSGDRVGLFVVLTQTGAIAGTPGGFANVPVAAQLSMTLSNSFGGTGTTPSTATGNATCLNPYLVFTSGATNLGGGSGAEFDFSFRAGSSFMDINGILFLQDALSTVQGARDNIVLSFANAFTQTAGRGWKTSLFGVGTSSGFFPLDPLASIFTFNTPGGTMHLASFMDASGVTFSSTFMKFPGGSIDAGGVVRSPQLVATSAADANYVLVNPAGTGDGPSVWFAGTDTNVNGEAYTQGTGSFSIGTQPTGNLMAQFTPVASSISYAQIKPAASGGSISLDVAGTATGITIGGTIATSLVLGASGITTQILGTIKGAAGSFTANGSVATAMSSLGPAGSHATIQEWLTITDAGGTVRYIPCF